MKRIGLILFLAAASLAAQAQQQTTLSADQKAHLLLDIKQLVQMARDPDSVVLDAVWASIHTAAHGKDKGQQVTNICILYRARNGFGGMNRGAAY